MSAIRYGLVGIAVALVAWVLTQKDPIFCSTDSMQEVISPTREYVATVWNQACNLRFAQTEISLRKTSQNDQEVVWESRGKNYESVGVSWSNDSTLKLRIPAGSRRSLQPEFDHITIVYDEYH